MHKCGRPDQIWSRDLSLQRLRKVTAVICIYAVIGGVATSACAGQDRSGADCVSSGVTRLGSSEGATLRVVCEVPEMMVIVVIPSASLDIPEPPPNLVPKEISALIRSSRAEGRNWCAFPDGELSTLVKTGTGETLRFVCTTTLAEVAQYEVATGRIIEIDLVRDRKGAARIAGLRARIKPE
jgi:hypothetical protein